MEREITIGVDFGTASTKVGFREADARAAFVVPAELSGSLLWPSVVGIDPQRRLYFGEGLPATVHPERWLKMRLTESEGAEPGRQAAIKERFGCYAEPLCAFYIAYAIGRARTAAASRWPRDHLHFTCNLGAPLDKTSDRGVCRGFERVVRIALDLSEKAGQGWQIDAAMEAWNEAVARPEPSEAFREAFVVPETHAAVTGTLLDRALPDGHFAAVDIGAGTTDIAVFLFQRQLEGDSIYNGRTSYFIDATEPVASYNVDVSLTQLFWNSLPGFDRPCSREDLQRHVQQAKEQLGDIVCEVPGWPAVPRGRAEEVVRGISLRLGEHFMKTWFRAFEEKDKNAEHWPVLYLLPLGGGSLFRPFARCIGRHPLAAAGRPLQICPQMEVRSVDVDYTDQLLVHGAQGDQQVHNGRLLTILCGLTYHPGTIPELYRPGQVDPVPTKTVDDQQFRNIGKPYDHA